jgi:allantoinase
LTRADLVIKGGTIVRSDAVFKGNIAVKNGQIVAITDEAFVPASEECIDASGLYVMTGVIEPHLHLRDPSVNEREDFTSGTMACAAGGITTIVEHPISTPSVHSATTLKNRIEAVKHKSLIDFGFYGGAGHDNLDLMLEMAEAGIMGFKTFLPDSPPGREQEFTGLNAKDDGFLYQILELAAKTNIPALFHLEDQKLLQLFEGRVRGQGRKDPMAHIEARPEIAEIVAVAKLLAMAQDTGAKVQLVHMSTDRGLELAKFYRKQGVSISIESCPQYLLLSEEDMEAAGPFAKMNPPLRSKETQRKLWNYIHDGTIDMIVTDHSPFLVSEKEAGYDDIFKAPPGHPGLETLLPLMLNEVAKGRLTWNQLSSLLAENVARIYRMDQKGRIDIGKDADFVLIDMKQEWKVDASQMYTRSKGTFKLFDGWNITGRPVKTILRGKVIMENGEVIGKPGEGRFLRPAPEMNRRDGSR